MSKEAMKQYAAIKIDPPPYLDGRPMTLPEIVTMLQRTLKSDGLEGRTYYDLRSAATILEASTKVRT